VAPDEYHFSVVTNPDDNSEQQRPEDIIKATDEQLAVWQDIDRIAQQRCINEQTSNNDDDDDDDDDNNDDNDDEESNNELKERLLELWMLLICHMTSARWYESPLLSFCAMLSIKLSTKSWMEPGNFNSSLSAIIWVV
jgi:hypothetical protein